MALRLRLRGPGGKQHTATLAASSTLRDLQAEALSAFDIKGDAEFLLGFPPALCTSSGDTCLADLVKSGDSIVVREVAGSAPPDPAPPSAASATADIGASAPATGASDWSCPQCTLLNPVSDRECGACGFIQKGSGGGSGGGAMTAQLVKMPDDNSCLFHGIAHLLDASSTATQLRQIIAKEVRANARWDEATLGKPKNEYIDFITSPIRWGGQVEIAIFAEAFKAEIAVVEVQSGRSDIYGQGSGFDKRVYLLHSGIHFDAVTFGGSRVVSVSDFAAADAGAKELAVDQKASGNFVDQDKMRLRCKICGYIAEGDYAARSHAGSTGHKEFAPA